jgi:hypothetical protein
MNGLKPSPSMGEGRVGVMLPSSAILTDRKLLKRSG